MNGSKDFEKPFKGRLRDWRIIKTSHKDYEGYVIGEFMDHPQFSGKRGRTSMIVKKEYGDDGYNIETLNSQYLLPYDEEEIVNYN